MQRGERSDRATIVRRLSIKAFTLLRHDISAVRTSNRADGDAPGGPSAPFAD